jgi:FkbM family methyltransferase
MTTTMSDLFVDGSVVKASGAAIVYGLGSAGRDVFKALTEAGVRVRSVIDRRARSGDTYAGVPMYPLAACPIDRAERAAIPVVIGIFNRDVDVPAVARELRDGGFLKVVSFVGIHAEFPDTFGDRFWLTKRAYPDAHRADIARAERLLTDERSLALYRSLIALRASGEYGPSLAPNAGERQYLPRDVPGWLARRPVRFVDCGAYRGDTLEDLLAAGLDIEASAHFEPDIENFARLVSLLRERRRGSAASAWPCAVSDRPHPVGFSHDGEASTISVGASGTVPAVALDDVLIGWRPTFIKMDIEGSEVEALLGARGLIAEQSPSLAVCVYHRPDHLWRIPLLLSGWRELSCRRNI